MSVDTIVPFALCSHLPVPERDGKATALGAATISADVTEEPTNIVKEPGTSSARTSSPNPSKPRPAISSPPLQPVGKVSETPEDDNTSVSSFETAHENFDSRSNSPVPLRDPVVSNDEHGNIPASECFLSLLSRPMLMRISVPLPVRREHRQHKKGGKRTSGGLERYVETPVRH